jgi:ferredoxin
MGLLPIDHDKCKQDGLCAADCPVGIIHFEGAGTVVFRPLIKNLTDV